MSRELRKERTTLEGDSVPILLWPDEPHDAPAQMARDTALLESAAAGTLPGTVLRLYTFDPPGITLGRAQDPARELDLAALERESVRWARRPTGGRAIWHDEEWTFSLVTSLGPGGWARTPSAAYQRTGRLLVEAFRLMGVPVELAPGSPRGPGSPRVASGAAPPCFASTARHELVLAGRKVAGIAQRVVRGALLQQGSLLLGDSHATLARFVPAGADERLRLAAAWREAAAPAGRWLGADRSLARLAGVLEGLLDDVGLLDAGELADSLGLPELPRRSG